MQSGNLHGSYFIRFKQMPQIGLGVNLTGFSITARVYGVKIIFPFRIIYIYYPIPRVK